MSGKKRLMYDYKVIDLAPRKGKRRMFCGPARLAWFPHAKLKAHTGFSLRKRDGYSGLRWALDMHHENYLTWDEKWAFRDKKRSIKALNSL